MKCRMCSSQNLELFLDLGFVPMVDTFLTKDDLNKSETTYPLNLKICNDCGLVQLGYIIPAELLYNEKYSYESGTTQKRLQSYDGFVKDIIEILNLPKNSLVVDIGSNIGVLLSCFKKRGIDVLGIEPSVHIAKLANDRGIETINGFFEDKIVNQILSLGKYPSVVTATNVFAHIQDYDTFADSLKRLMKEDGVFVFQVPYFLHLLRNLEYDTVYHEHLCYFSLKPLKKFFEKQNMEIFEILETDLDGGSIRCFVTKKGVRKISSNVIKMFENEDDEKIYSKERLEKFAKDVQKQKKNLVELLIELKKDNKRIVGVSAPAKGMTLLNYCKIDASILEYLTEKSDLKIGKFSPGMHIEVKPDSILFKDKPDYALLLAWNFAEEIMLNLKEFKTNGGKFIIPIPYPKIV